ncbi:MAG: response regulator [Saprospiraceae bacterium]|nr:MAG: response regulator [Saprospiraceae bacterium]
MNKQTSKVILVEDNMAEAGLVKFAFKEQSVATELIHCHDGEELMALLSTVAPDIIRYILLDLNMPGMNGYEVLKRFSADENWKKLPVIVFSSSSHQSDVRTCYELGANAYVCKPIDFNEFDEAIRCINAFWGGVNLGPVFES